MDVMTPEKKHYQFTVILCFFCTDMHVNFFHNFHFDLNLKNYITNESISGSALVS